MSNKEDLQTMVDGRLSFSLVQGGALYQLFCRSGLSGTDFEYLWRRVIAVVLLTWFPMFLISLFTKCNDGVQVSFFYDIETHVKFLLGIPLLFFAEIMIHSRLSSTVNQFIDRDLIPPEERPLFYQAIKSTHRLRDSVPIELGMIIVAYTIGAWLWRDQTSLDRQTWYAFVDGSGKHLTSAGYWLGYLSIPFFQFILLRWYFRIFIWFRFLWQVSKLNLQLFPTHPDGAAGIGFIGNSVTYFSPYLFANGALLSGLIANHIFYSGQKLMDYKADALGLVLFQVMLIVAPLLMFTPRLLQAKWKGRREYGLLANRYVREFDEKWIRGGAESSEQLIGSGDIQSLADLGNSYAVVSKMRIFPLDISAIPTLFISTLVPLLPLLLTLMSLEDIIDWFINFIL